MSVRILILILFLQSVQQLHSQTYKPDLQDKAQLSITNREIKPIGDKKGIHIAEGQGSPLITVNNIIFSEGTIEFDAKGRNLMGQSFLGFAFHIQNDSMYDAIYFRPFNFSNPDTVRRWRAVQYISLPDNDWDKLRQNFPGKYENKVHPVPGGDDWFHCKIIIENRTIAVFVNNAPDPSLVVSKLSNTTKGRIALWVENSCEGSFANLVIKSKD